MRTDEGFQKKAIVERSLSEPRSYLVNSAESSVEDIRKCQDINSQEHWSRKQTKSNLEETEQNKVVTTHYKCVVRCSLSRVFEHLDPAKSAISKHLTDCDNANYLININNLYDNVLDNDSLTGDSPHYSFTNIIQNNTRILHSLKFSNSNLLLFLEALHIKFKKPELNSGLKASKELVVFP